MHPADPSPDDDRSARLEAEILPLLARVRTAVADPLFGPGRDALRRFLSDAPVGVCVRLYEAWQTATGAGDPVQVVAGRLTPENRFILDLVTTIYSVPDPADATSQFPDYAELAKLEGHTPGDPPG